MKKNDIFTFTAPNGAEVTAVVIAKVGYEVSNYKVVTRWLCYAQNRLFTYEESYPLCHDELSHKFQYDKVLIEYCILPDYDELLKAEQQQFNEDCYEALSSIGDMEF